MRKARSAIVLERLLASGMLVAGDDARGEVQVDAAHGISPAHGITSGEAARHVTTARLAAHAPPQDGTPSRGRRSGAPLVSGFSACGALAD